MQCKPSGTVPQAMGWARQGCRRKARSGRHRLWVVTNHSQQMSWSRRRVKQEAERVAEGRQGTGLGRVGVRQQEGKDHAERRAGRSAPHPTGGPRAGGTYWHLPPSLGAAGGARACPALAGAADPAQTGACPQLLGLPRPQSPGTAGHLRVRATSAILTTPGSPCVQAAPPRLPRTWRRHCGSDARSWRYGRRRRGEGVLPGGPGPGSQRPCPWPSSRGTSIFQSREGRLSFGH